ncbi:MAG: hypothetical protein ACJZ59_08640 [Candidatus Thalassarchaeaceae archaeon]
MGTIGGSAGGIIGFFAGRQQIISNYMSRVRNEENEGLPESFFDAVLEEFVQINLWNNYGSAVLAYMILGICTGSLIGSIIQNNLPTILGNTTGDDE